MNIRLLWLSSPVYLIAGFAAGYLQYDHQEVPARRHTNTDTAADGRKSERGEPQRDLGEVILQAVSYPSQLHRDHALAELIAQLKPDEFHRAVEAALRLPKEQRADLLCDLYTSWAEHAPEAACQHARQYAVHERGVMEAALHTWMRQDPAAVLAWAGQLSEHERRPLNWYAFNAAVAIGKDAPEDAAALIIEFGAGNWTTGKAVSEFFRDWTSRDPQRAAAKALEIRVGTVRAPAIEGIAEAWGQRDPRGALRWLANVSNERVRQMAEARVLGIWATQDANAAAAYARQLPDDTVRNSALAKVAAGLLEKNPQAAGDFAEQVPLEIFKGDNFYYLWSKRDPAAATAAFARRVAELDPSGRREYEGELAQMFRSWSESAPQFAIDFASSQPDGVRGVLLVEAAERWADKDRAAAIQWGTSLPEGEMRAIALGSIASRWAWLSTNETAAWLQSLPPGASREAAVTGFAKTAIRMDAEGALSWLRTIPDPQRSADALGEAWRTWVNEGGFSAAMRWFKEAKGLTPRERASLERAERSFNAE